MGQFAWLNESEMLVFDDTAGASGERASLALRFANEPARHKLLDLIGDLALLGQPLQARVTATKSGHALTAALCRKIAAMGG
jgi:UDP-3-O-[3-hydroxymyristoyl] N-acetylglucosamine deacetylase/3-hydroxyacyl-[acyl-carrier-protein] dehydratase